MSHEIKIRQFEDRDRLEHVYSWDCACGQKSPHIYSEILGAVTDAAVHLVEDFLEDLDEPFELEGIDIIESLE